MVRGVPAPRFRDDVAATLDALLARLPPDRILAVETPDYTVTPMGGSVGEPGGPAGGDRRLQRGHRRGSAPSAGSAFVDGIFAISSDAAADLRWSRPTGSPSAAQYRRWVVERIEPAVRGLLARP